MLAALASAAMPNITVATVRTGRQSNATDESHGIDHAVVKDTAGRSYDVYASDGEDGRKRLGERVRAARVLDGAREMGALGFGLDRVLAFEDGSKADGPTGMTAVLITAHHDGEARNLDLLTLDDCAAVGTAIGAIHRLNPPVLRPAGYPIFVTEQIHTQLEQWIGRLKVAGHIPTEITDSWSRVIGTEGLWSFGTCFVHGGFADGDMLFSGTTITSITNWQNMQVNDPARDLAWIFAKLDDEHRNAVLAAYGRIMGSRLDDLIMLRANLWLQMEQVGEFVQALGRADNARIMQFKAQVDRLAHQLAVATRKINDTSESRRSAVRPERRDPSTITIGTLLDDGRDRRAAAGTATVAGTKTVAETQAAVMDDDHTDSTQVAAAGTWTDTDSTSDRPAYETSSVRRPATAPTMAVTRLDRETMRDGITPELDDDTDETGPRAAAQADPSSTATTVIPLLEQEERALRDAQAGLAFRTAHATVSSAMPATDGDTDADTDDTDPGTRNGGGTDEAEATDRMDDDDTDETTPKA